MPSRGEVVKKVGCTQDKKDSLKICLNHLKDGIKQKTEEAKWKAVKEPRIDQP